MSADESKDAAGVTENMQQKLLIDDSTGIPSNATFLEDITLRGCDGVDVGANKSLLAEKSPVFQGMLFRNFSEATSSVVEVGFEGWIIQAIVEYSSTGKVAFLCQEGASSPSIELASKIRVLADAASYYDMKELTEHIEERSTQAMKTDPNLALAVIEECREQDIDTPSSSRLAALAFDSFRSDPKKILSTSMVPSLAISTLEAILVDTKMDWKDELHRFLLIQQWAATEEEERGVLEVLPLTKEIRFELVGAKDLATTVASSGLVAQNWLSDAYKARAVQQEHYTEVRRLLHHTEFDLAASLNAESTATVTYDGSFMDWQPHINTRMRAILVDWLLEIHNTFCFSPETLFLSINMVDFILKNTEITRSKLQLVGVTAMLMASKCDRVGLPLRAETAAGVCATYTMREVMRMEFTLMEKFDHKLPTLNAHNFLDCIFDKLHTNLHLWRISQMVLESTLFSVELLGNPPSKLATASIAVARRAHGMPVWCAKLQDVTGYSEHTILPVVSDIITCKNHLPTGLKALNKKWSLPKNGSIADTELVPLPI